MTDVSAGALAAGTGALPGLGKPSGAPVGKSDFETELSAFADVVTNGVPGMQDGAEFAGGEFPLAFAALFNPGAAGSDPAADGELPQAAGPAGVAPEADGDAGAPVPAGAVAPLPGPFVPLAGNHAGAPESGPPTLPGTAKAPLADATSSSSQPIRPFDVVSNSPERQPADASPLPPVLPAQPGVPNGPAPSSQAASGPAAPQNTGPAPVNTAPVTPAPGAPAPVTPAPVPPAHVPPAAGFLVPDAGAPEDGPVASTPRTAEAAQRPAHDVAPTNQHRPAQGAVPQPAAQPAAEPLANGRRWQTELPSELRAPAPAFQKTADIVLPSQAPAASAPAGAQASSPAGASAPAAAGVQALTSPGAVPVLPAVQPETGAGAAQPVSPEPADGLDPLTASRSANAGDGSTAAPLVQVARQASQNAGPQPMMRQAAADPSPEVEPEGFEPVSLKVEATAKDAKASVPNTAAGPQPASQGSQPGPHSGPQAATTAAEARAQAGPLAAAVLAAQLPLDDPEGLTKPMEFSTAGDFAATVRGGETHGAVRTESLQTPNQAQSGQVATQVAAEIARNLKNGQTRFQMRFDPPELGRVDVNMRVGADGGVHAHLIVERPETLDMFLRDQRGLERALEAAGLNADSDNLQFSLKQDGGRGFASGDGQGDQPGQLAEDAGGSESEDLDPETEEVIRLTLAESRGGLDVKI